MCDMTEPVKGCSEQGYVAKQHTKEQVLADGIGDESWGRNAWLGEPFPSFARQISGPESYDQSSKGLLYYTKIILNSKVL